MLIFISTRSLLSIYSGHLIGRIYDFGSYNGRFESSPEYFIYGAVMQVAKADRLWFCYFKSFMGSNPILYPRTCSLNGRITDYGSVGGEFESPWVFYFSTPNMNRTCITCLENKGSIHWAIGACSPTKNRTWISWLKVRSSSHWAMRENIIIGHDLISCYYQAPILYFLLNCNIIYYLVGVEGLEPPTSCM